MKQKIILLEFSEDYAQIGDNDLYESTIIPLSNEVVLYLEKNTIDYVLPESLFKHPLEASLIVEYEYELKNFIHYLDNKSYDFFKEIKTNQLKLFDWHSYYFKNLLENIKFKCLILNQIFYYFKPKEVIYFYINNIKVEFNKDFEYYDSIYSELLDLKEFSQKCVYKKIPSIVKKSSFFTKNDTTVKEKKSIREFIWKFKNKCKNFLLKKNDVNIIINEGYDVAYLKPELTTHFNLISFSSLNLEKYIKFDAEDIRSKEFLDAISHDDNFEKILTYKNVNIFPVINKFLFFFINKFPNLITTCLFISNYLINYHIKAFLSFSFTPYIYGQSMLAALCRKNNIPTVCWVHGGGTLMNANYIMEHIDYKYADYYFVYGTLQKKYLEQSPYPFKNIIVSGSPRIDSLSINNSKLPFKNQSEKIKVLHISGPLIFCKNEFLPIHFNISKQYKNVIIKFIKLVEQMKQIENIDYKVKIYKNCVERFKLLNFFDNNLILDEYDDFAHYISNYDIYIVDMLSTPLLELCRFNKKVIYFGSHYRNAFIKNALNKKIFVAETIPDLIKIINKVSMTDRTRESQSDISIIEKANKNVFTNKLVEVITNNSALNALYISPKNGSNKTKSI